MPTGAVSRRSRFCRRAGRPLLSKDYAAKQRAGIDLDRATPWTDALSATPPREGGNTTHFSVADSLGNAVSNTYTLNFSYGVGLVAEGTGVLLNNELDDFTAAPARQMSPPTTAPHSCGRRANRAGYTLIVDGRGESRYVVPDRAVFPAPQGCAGCRNQARL